MQARIRIAHGWRQPWPRLAVYLLLLASLLMRLDHRFHYRNFNIDTEGYLAATYHWSQGRGFVTLRISTEDLSQLRVKPERAFMPGYGLAAYAVYQVTGDWLQSTWWLEVLSLLLLYAATHGIWYGLSGRENHPGYLWYLAWLAFSPAPLHYLNGAGSLSLACFALATLGCLWAFRRPSLQTAALIWALFCLSLAAWLRYAYWPFLALVPGVLLWQWLQTRSRHILVLALGSLTAMSLIGTGLVLYQWGYDSYLDAPTRGFYPNHLLYLEPFPFKAFFYYGLPHVLALEAISPWLGYGLTLGAWTASLLLLYVLFREGKARWQSSSVPWARPWMQWGLLTGILTLGMLSWLSLTWPPEYWNWIGFWTFVMEPRYYVPIMWLLSLTVFAWAFGSTRHWTRYVLKGLVMLAILSALTYPLYLKYRIHIQGDRSGTFPTSEIVKLDRAVDSLVQVHGLPLVVATPHDTHIGDVYGAITLPMDSLLSLEHLSYREPLTLLVQMPDSLSDQQKWLEAQGATLWTRWPGSGLYVKTGPARKRIAE